MAEEEAAGVLPVAAATAAEEGFGINGVVTKGPEDIAGTGTGVESPPSPCPCPPRAAAKMLDPITRGDTPPIGTDIEESPELVRPKSGPGPPAEGVPPTFRLGTGSDTEPEPNLGTAALLLGEGGLSWRKAPPPPLELVCVRDEGGGGGGRGGGKGGGGGSAANGCESDAWYGLMDLVARIRFRVSGRVNRDHE